MTKMMVLSIAPECELWCKDAQWYNGTLVEPAGRSAGEYIEIKDGKKTVWINREKIKQITFNERLKDVECLFVCDNSFVVQLTGDVYTDSNGKVYQGVEDVDGCIEFIPEADLRLVQWDNVC
jgi:hypothetical protein